MAFDFIKKLFGIKKEEQQPGQETPQAKPEPLKSIALPFCNECKSPVEEGYQKTAYYNGQKVTFHKYCFRKLKRKAESQIYAGQGGF